MKDERRNRGLNNFRPLQFILLVVVLALVAYVAVDAARQERELADRGVVRSPSTTDAPSTADDGRATNARGVDADHDSSSPVSRPQRHTKGRSVQHRALGRDVVYFSGHALERMEQRGINEQDVFDVLEHPTEKGLSTQPGRNHWRMARPGAKSVDVVFALDRDKVAIITVFEH